MIGSSGEPDSPVAESGEEYNGVSRLIDMVEFSDPQNLAEIKWLCSLFYGLAPLLRSFVVDSPLKKTRRDMSQLGNRKAN